MQSRNFNTHKDYRQCRQVCSSTLTRADFSFFGVILVTQSDSKIASTDTSDLPTHPILGDMLALTSACCFAVYVVLMKVKLGSEDRADMQMLLGYVFPKAGMSRADD